MTQEHSPVMCLILTLHDIRMTLNPFEKYNFSKLLHYLLLYSAAFSISSNVLLRLWAALLVRFGIGQSFSERHQLRNCLVKWSKGTEENEAEIISKFHV